MELPITRCYSIVPPIAALALCLAVCQAKEPENVVAKEKAAPARFQVQSSLGMKPKLFAQSADSKRWATASPLGEVVIWDPQTKDCIARYSTGFYQVNCKQLVFSPDGKQLAFRTLDGSYLFDLTGDRSTRQIDEIKFPKPARAPSKNLSTFGKVSQFSQYEKAASVSHDGRRIALLGKDKALRLIRLDESPPTLKVVPGCGDSSYKQELEYYPSGLLGRFTETFHIYDDEGGLIAKAPKNPKGESSGMLPPDLAYVTWQGSAFFYTISDKGVSPPPDALRAAKNHLFSGGGHFASDKRSLLLERQLDPPDWKLFGRVSDKDQSPMPTTLFTDRKKSRPLWLNQKRTLCALDPDTKKISELETFEFPINLECRASRACPDLLCVQGLDENRRWRCWLISGDSEKIIFESRVWSSFQDVMVPFFMDVTPDRKHAWFCGLAGDLILVELESGQPKLRIYTWQDGALVFETPAGEVTGNELGLKKIRVVNAEGTATKPVGSWPDAKTSRQKVEALLKASQTPSE